MAGFGGRAKKILKSATEQLRVVQKVLVYWYEARARCDQEITLPERVRTHLDKKLIALRSRESSPWFFVDSLSSSSEPESYSES